ncbi:hypothetical protein KY328_03080, partial [Candidatus Woesearchaeota archaeon]|nr:hypothetical protein [Candidatus Woesearchaeota archaeon]
EKKKIAKQIIETALEHIKGPSGAILTYDNSDEAQVIRDIRAADVPVGLMSDRDIQTEMRVIAASKGMRHR